MYWTHRILYFTCLCGLLCCQLELTRALPVRRERAVAAGDGLEVPPPEILRFMRRFGYLESNPDNAEALYHESAIIEAIRNVQKYGAINQTGRLDGATLELFTKPRCGVPDLEGVPYYLQAMTTTSSSRYRNNSNRRRSRRYVIGAKPWTKRRIRYFIANWSMKLTAANVERDIARAFELWSRYSGLQFVRINSTAADIIVGFGSRYHGDSYPFDGPGNILAHAYYPYEMGSWGGDLHFDEDEHWQQYAENFTDGVNFYAVAVHELGHSLGLAHSPVYNSIMFPYYKGAEHATLDVDDTRAMYDMYLNKQLEENVDDDIDEHGSDAARDASNADDNNDVDIDGDDDDANGGGGDAGGGANVNVVETVTAAFTPTFQGDYETVTQHKIRYGLPWTTTATTIPATNTLASSPTTTTTTTSSTMYWATPTSPVTQTISPPPNAVPNICEAHFDAVTVFNGAVHIFKGAYIWRLTEHYTVDVGYPVHLSALFPALTAARVDAAYRRFDGAIVIFSGAEYWIFNGTMPIEDSPKALAQLLQTRAEEVAQLDAAMLWPKNNYTYLFAGARFWRYDMAMRHLHAGYPKPMQRWPGIPNDIDAAATLTNGKTYFFKDKLYWLYNNARVRVERGYPRRAAIAWLGCARPTKTALRNVNTTVAFISSFASASAALST